MVVQFLHNRLPEKVRQKWPINRLINDVLILLIVLLGWLVVDQRKNLGDTQDCIREYLVSQSAAQQPRNQANIETDNALAAAISTIPPLLQTILSAAADSNNLQLQQQSLDAVRNTNRAFSDFNVNFAELKKARANFPIPPAPENLCKD